MAETPSDQSVNRTQSLTQPQPGPDPDDSPLYWCYHCDKRVSIETLEDLHEVVCYECKNGFVELINRDNSRAATNLIDDPTFGDHFIQMLHLTGQPSRAEHTPSQTDPSDEDYLREELDGWDIENHDDEDERSVEVNEDEDGDGWDDEDEEDQTEPIGVARGVETDDEEEMRRMQRDVLRLRLRDFATRAASRRNRILDWSEILMGLEDQSIELRLQVPGSDNYIGNPGDYVDATGYEALLQNLAESDSSGRRGAPPAAKTAVDGLESLIIDEEGEALVCAICKDSVNVGEFAKTLPCGHGYHGECIVPWLGSRNSCPVCRFELPTDDTEYEEQREKRAAGLRAGSSSGFN